MKSDCAGLHPSTASPPSTRSPTFHSQVKIDLSSPLMLPLPTEPNGDSPKHARSTELTALRLKDSPRRDELHYGKAERRHHGKPSSTRVGRRRGKPRQPGARVGTPGLERESSSVKTVTLELLTRSLLSGLGDKRMTKSDLTWQRTCMEDVWKGAVGGVLAHRPPLCMNLQGMENRKAAPRESVAL